MVPVRTPLVPPGPRAEEADVAFPESEMRLKDQPPDGPSWTKSPPWAMPEPQTAPPQTPKGLRQHPWPLDVLLFPASVSCLLNLVVFWGGSTLAIMLAQPNSFYPGGILEMIADAWLMRQSRPLRSMGVGILILATFVTACLTRYLAECVRESSRGGTRAPDSPGIIDAAIQVQNLLLALLAFGIPAGVYALARWGLVDSLSWTIVGCAGFFLPMALLSMILFDSMSGLNPRYWLLSVVRVLVPYGALVVALAAIVGLVAWVVRITEQSLVGLLLLAMVILYTATVIAHILGRFYFRYSQRIGWGI